MKKHLLSKSTFMYGCQCPLRLYLHKFKPELRNAEDEAQSSIFAAGTNIGLLAQQAFPGGIDLSPPDAFSYHLAVERTTEMIASGKKIIYEAAFNFEGILCAIDILVKQKGAWYAYEVKNSTRVKPPHLMDAALQYHVITKAGLALKDFFVMNLNTAYVRKGDLDVKQLFKATSVLAEIKAKQSFITGKAAELKKMLQSKKEPLMLPGDHCFEPYDCDFTEHCWQDLEDDEEAVDHGEIDINKAAIAEFTENLKYPLYFFDFETVMPSVPPFDASRSYQQLPFQYSLHVQHTKNAAVKHLAFLGDGVNDPREHLTKALLKDIGSKGTVLVWNKAFEITRLKELGRDFPKYEKKLTSIINRIEDLMLPFKRKHYRHPAFAGSASIKSVLPVLVPKLSYETLEVQNGAMATSIYANLKDQNKATQAKQRRDLLAYCHLDTLAMVKILEQLTAI
jgi:hypothetical protein